MRIITLWVIDGGSSQLYYLFTDHLGSTSEVRRADGSLHSRQYYRAFGEERYTSGALPTDRTYTGQRKIENGLVHYGARAYDPVLARFAQADTIIPQPGNPMAWDRFAYTLNNPIINIDPSGNFTCETSFDGCSRKFTTYLHPDEIMIRYLYRFSVNKGNVLTLFGAPNTWAVASGVNIPTDDEEYKSFITSTDPKTGKPYGLHPGIDKAGRSGDQVYAVAPGKVTAIIQDDSITAPGYVLIIEHEIEGTLYYSVYYHLQAVTEDGEHYHMETNLHVGSTVHAGDVVAHIGDTGSKGSPHLHFEVRRSGGVQVGGNGLNNENGYWLSNPDQLRSTWLDISAPFGGYAEQYPY